MLYLITFLDGSQTYMNERIIQEIKINKDGSYTLIHFNEKKIDIKSFNKDYFCTPKTTYKVFFSTDEWKVTCYIHSKQLLFNPSPMNWKILKVTFVRTNLPGRSLQQFCSG